MICFLASDQNAVPQLRNGVILLRNAGAIILQCEHYGIAVRLVIQRFAREEKAAAEVSMWSVRLSVSCNRADRFLMGFMVFTAFFCLTDDWRQI